jgi:alpha-tubulin suppressor-like RCC1 family protein
MVATALPIFGYILDKDESRTYVVKWQQSPIPMQVRLPTAANFSDGTSPSGTMVDAMQVWNAQLGTVQFSPVSGAPGTYRTGNGVSEIVMDSTVDDETFPAGVLAVTLSVRNGRNSKDESDVVFNAGYTWDSYRGDLRGTVMDMRRVALHELGHVLGLLHPDEYAQNVVAIMNSGASDIDGLKSDDIAGAQKLYGAPGFMPQNDNLASAIPIDPREGQVRVEGTNIAATREPGEPGHAGATSLHSVGWKWQAPDDGAVSVTTLGSDFDTTLGVYIGTDMSSLSEVAANDDEELPTNPDDPARRRTSLVKFHATRGNAYFFAVDGWSNDEDTPRGFTGSITLAVTFYADVAPYFATHYPVPQTIHVGGSVTFTADAVGTPTPTLQWQRRSNGGEWTDLVEGGAFSGTSGRFLTVNTTLDMDGVEFRCVATSSVGTTISSVASLSVIVVLPPEIIAQPHDTTFYLGHYGELVADVSGATEYQWYHDGVLLPDRTGNRFGRFPVGLADAGRYQLVASNVGGSVSTARVTVNVAPVERVVAVAAAEDYALFLRADGSRWAMGKGHWGWATDVAFPRALPSSSSDIVAIAAGSEHDLFLKRDGTLWGRGGNSFGQLGDGTTEGHDVPVKIASGVRSVVAGSYATFFVKSDGSLWGMGRDEWGLFDGSTPANRLEPVKIADSVREVSVTYAFALFVKNDNSLWGVGANWHGTLGEAAQTKVSTPTKLADGVVTMSAGQQSSFFVKADGSLWGMGENSHGELGDGTTTERHKPVHIAEAVTRVSAGTRHSLFLKDDGSLWQTGNEGGEFNQTSASDTLTPRQVDRDVVSMVAGPNASYYMKADGSLWATGANRHGQLGLGFTSADETTPQIVYGTADIVIITQQPNNTATILGDSPWLKVEARGYPPPLVQWQRNGADIPGATSSSFNVLYFQPAAAGLYRAILTSGSFVSGSAPAILGTVAFKKVIGEGMELEPHDIRHPNGNIFDQVLLTGAAESITADFAQNQVTRTSFIDLDGDIVQVEFSGPGTLSLVLDNPSVRERRRITTSQTSPTCRATPAS